jgi:hypothetical protein
MKEQPHYDNLLTKQFLEEYYVQKGMSCPQISQLLQHMGYNVWPSTVHKYLKKHGLGRTCSEAKRKLDPNAIDWNESHLDEGTLEAIDGFLLGDGHVQVYEPSKSGRLTCGQEHQEFCLYQMSFFRKYDSQVQKVKHKKMSSGHVWCGRTKYHPDFFVQHKRWYRANPKGGYLKFVPDDIRITPRSLTLWYLGDGSVHLEKNTIALKLHTNGLPPSDVEVLCQKLVKLGISCHRENTNRIFVEAKGILKFFEFVGKESPVSCYGYKYKIPSWRFESKRMREVARELGADYQRLAYLVKIGKIPCLRVSENGKPRFLPEHVEVCKKLIESGELY